MITEIVLFICGLVIGMEIGIEMGINKYSKLLKYFKENKGE